MYNCALPSNVVHIWQNVYKMSLAVAVFLYLKAIVDFYSPDLIVLYCFILLLSLHVCGPFPHNPKQCRMLHSPIC